MDVIHWTDKLETGFSEVDQQHRHLVNVTNEFGILLSRDQFKSAQLKKVYSELVAYTEYHFDEEEKLMSLAGVSSKHLKQHQLEHRGFLEDVSCLHIEILSGQNNARSLFNFLMHWLVYHILGSDMCMARQIVAIKNGCSADEAYAMSTEDVDKATGLLLSSMNNLFSQMTFRNRQLRELNQSLEEKVKERTQALSEANQQLATLASTDVLTGLSNRRHAMQMLEQLWQEATAKDLPLACLVIDADGFKQINDNYGHDAGDTVLRELAKHLQYAVRTDDIVCRMGGDEFLIICPKTDQEGAKHVAALAHAEIDSLRVPVTGGEWRGSISVGVAAKNAEMQGVEDLIKAADRGVYAAKSAGKNCVMLAN